MSDPNLIQNVSSIWLDLIKIGIPSVVAIVGTLCSLIVTLRSNKKDIVIERLKHANEAERERFDRTGELAKLCAVEINRLHSTVISFTTFLFAKAESEEDGERFPENERAQLSDHYQSLIEEVHRGTTIQSYVRLLGSKSVVQAHSNYFSMVSRIASFASPNDYQGTSKQLLDEMEKIRDAQEAVLSKLADVYLMRSESQ